MALQDDRKDNTDGHSDWEQNLPEFLQESIQAMVSAWDKLDRGEEYNLWDCDYCSLQSDINSAEVNRIIGRRMRNVKDQSETIAAQQPILDALAQRYGTQPGDLAALQHALDTDNSMWEQAAEEAGMSVEQYREYQRMQRENMRLREAQQNFFQRQRQQQQVQTWLAQAEEMKQDPLLADFDLQAEIDGNPDFLDLLKKGVSVEQAYKILHMDDFLGKATAQAEKVVTGNIRARGARPAENGAAAKSSAIVKDDVHSLSRADRAEIARRAAMGEHITF